MKNVAIEGLKGACLLGALMGTADVPPWRIRSAFGAFAVLEMAAGSPLHALRVGDVLVLVDKA